MRTPPPDWKFEEELHARGIVHVAGIDEAGRGPLAGPVVAGAVIFPAGCRISGVHDSKQLSPSARERLFDVIHHEALAVGIGSVDEQTIDRINILQATMVAMRKAVALLAIRPEHLLVDGNRFDGGGEAFSTIVKGDSLSISIAAASIVAKVTRDRMMVELDKTYPVYGFVRHKGYGTREHCDALRVHGPCPAHRQSFITNFRIHD